MAVMAPFERELLISCRPSIVTRERTVQPKLDRSDSILFSRVRPTIQYRSSIDHLVGGGVSGYM